jgi:Bifunctional DNA primase/polymerase, N-terminal/AAA domain
MTTSLNASTQGNNDMGAGAAAVAAFRNGQLAMSPPMIVADQREPSPIDLPAIREHKQDTQIAQQAAPAKPSPAVSVQRPPETPKQPPADRGSQYPSKLEAALDHARNGIRVLPVRPDTKIAAVGQWPFRATTNEDQIRKWWKDNPDYNIAGSADGLAIPDIDPRNGGSVEALNALGSLPNTQVSQTPGGGVHFFFDLPARGRVKKGKLAQGIDLQAGAGAYVLLPGSTINGRPYRWLEGYSPRDIKRACAPEWLLNAAKARRAQKSKYAGVQLATELDPEWAIERAEEYIRKLPEVVEGGRNNAAIEIVFELGDLPLSDAMILELMTEVDQTKFLPPLGPDVIAQKVQGNNTSRVKPRGWKGRPIGFEPVKVDESKHPRHSGKPYYGDAGERFYPTAKVESKGDEDKKDDENETKHFVSLATPFSFPDPTTINPPDWILEGLAARAEVSTVTGPGGVSKSTWQLLTAVAAVTGREDICGFRIPQREGRPRRERVWVWNQEDSLDTMNARVLAIMQEFGLSPDDLRDENGKPMLFLNSGRGRGNRLTLVERRGDFFRPTAQLGHVIKTAAHEGFGLTMLDPLVSLHQAAENVNEQMRVVFDHLADIAHDASCGVLVNCHTGKPDKKSSEGYAGDAYAIRGGSSQPDAVRVATTLMSMSEKDSKEWRIPQDHSHLDYARLDIAKINNGPKPSSPYWYRRKRIIVPGYRGGPLPVLRPMDLERVAGETNAQDMAAQIARTIRDHHALETWVPIADLLPHLPIDLAKRLSGKNRARELDNIFIPRDQVTAEGFGVLRRMTESGRRGTQLMLSVTPHSSNSSN